MQYLLSEEEYDELHRNHKQEIAELRIKITDLCMRVAMSEVIPDPWDMHRPEGEPKEGPWGCIRSKDPQKDPMYCDECPVDDICRYPGKEYSK